MTTNAANSNLGIPAGLSFFICFAVIILQSSICRTGTGYLSYLLMWTPENPFILAIVKGG